MSEIRTLQEQLDALVKARRERGVHAETVENRIPEVDIAIRERLGIPVVRRRLRKVRDGPKNAAAVVLGRAGGTKRAAGMTAEARRESAKKAARARWQRGNGIVENRISADDRDRQTEDGTMTAKEEIGDPQARCEECGGPRIQRRRLKDGRLSNRTNLCDSCLDDHASGEEDAG
jgi:hypothetical protein